MNQAPAVHATRMVAIRLPNGETEYWLTDRVFAIGDTYTRNGQVREVAEILPQGRNGRDHLVVRLKEPAR